ncbi:MAG: hypothetical protein HGA80_05640 [Candidatus Omnitrophica bacterium]|nr:hypothetical protein [Candidatus Omnitrophota bacterium]
MYALLILNNEKGTLRLIVRLQERNMQSRVVALLRDNKAREALNFIKARGEVAAYLPCGVKLPLTPRFTLVEDLV